MATLRTRGIKWQVQIRLHGSKPVSRTFSTKADAIAWARATEAELQNQIDTTPTGLESATPVTFRQILERYREQVTPQKKSHRHEANRISRLLKEPIADTNATDLTPGMIAAFRDRRLASVGPQAVIHDLTLLGHVIRIAINEWDLPLAENPVLKVRKPKPPQGRTRRLEEGELKRLIVAVETFTAPYMVDLIYFAVETAMRQSEILRAYPGREDLTV
jgi:integrase